LVAALVGRSARLGQSVRLAALALGDFALDLPGQLIQFLSRQTQGLAVIPEHPFRGALDASF
jgi:hypothetical protein